MSTSDPLLLFCGFSDKANIGDYALFCANRRLFGDSLIPQRDMNETSAGRLIVNLFGGGTYYPYALRGQYPRRKHNYALGVGVHEPEKGRFGMLTRLAMFRWRFKYLGVRGYRSEKVLTRHGVRSVVTGDTAMAIEPPRANEPPGDGTVGVSLVGESMQRRGSAADVFSRTEETCRRMLADGMRLRLFAFCRDDMPGMRGLQSRLDSHGAVELVDFWSAPIEQDLNSFLSEMEKCDVLIGERLHASVLAAVVNRPFVPIGYKPKCFDFVESLQIEELVCLEPAALQGQLLYDSVKKAMTGEPNRQQLAERVQYFRSRIEEGAQQITDSLRRLGGMR